MSRWLVLLPLLLQACASGAERDAEAAQAALASHRATMAALGAASPGRPTATIQAQPRATPGHLAALPQGHLAALPQGRSAAPMPGAQTPVTPPRSASSLLGATPEAVRAALGEPILQRSEGPAQVWLYAGAGCQLDIVIYASEAGPRVAHVQARAGGLAQRTEASCLRDLAGVGQGRGQGNNHGTGPDSSLRSDRPLPSALGHAAPLETDA